jgi:hypothetical protein
MLMVHPSGLNSTTTVLGSEAYMNVGCYAIDMGNNRNEGRWIVVPSIRIEKTEKIIEAGLYDASAWVDGLCVLGQPEFRREKRNNATYMHMDFVVKDPDYVAEIDWDKVRENAAKYASPEGPGPLSPG